MSEPTLSIDARSCIGCGACVLAAPELFAVTGGVSQVLRPPRPPEIRAATSALLICPTQAIKLRQSSLSPEPAPELAPARAAVEPPPTAVRSRLFPRLAQASESVRWSLASVDWEQLVPERASPGLRALVREMAFSEQATYSATQRFMQSFGDDVDFSEWLSVWFYEETRHPHVLIEWLRRLGEPVEDEFVLRGRVSTPFMKSRTGTLVTNVISEVTATAAYAAMARVPTEPVLARLASAIAGDEARHAASFLAFARARMDQSAEPERERLDALKVLHFWLNEQGQVSHPINQMLERVAASGHSSAAAALASEVPFDFDAVKRRVTRLVGLLCDLPRLLPAEVWPTLHRLTSARHGRGSSTGEPPAAPQGEPSGAS